MARRNASRFPVALVILVVLGGIAAGGYLLARRGGVLHLPGEDKPQVAATPGAEGGDFPVELYFSSKDGGSLIPERRRVAAPEDALGRCRVVLDELRRGPSERLAALLPVEFEVRSLILAGDTLVVDLQPGILGAAVGAVQEALLWASVTDSIVMSVRDVAAVQFLVEGQERDVILGHVNTRGPFGEQLDLVRWP